MGGKAKSPRLLSYPGGDLPPEIKYQVLSFLRIEWPWRFRGERRWGDSAHQATRPVSFVIVEGDLLISHAEVSWRVIRHHDQEFSLYGLGSVFTYPGFRREGFAAHVVGEATRFIRRSDGDLALLFCPPALEALFAADGWETLPGLRIGYGSPDAMQIVGGETILGLLLSERARQQRSDLLDHPLYAGEETW